MLPRRVGACATADSHANKNSCHMIRTAGVPVMFAGPANPSTSSAHPRRCSLPSPYFGAGWQVRAAGLEVTRAEASG